MIPGEVFIKDGDIELNAGRKPVTLRVANTGDRPIQVGSHYHFFETNPALKFDRKKARGMRLDIAAGTAVRFEPGQTREVRLVALRRQAHDLRFPAGGHGKALIDDDICQAVANAGKYATKSKPTSPRRMSCKCSRCSKVGALLAADAQGRIQADCQVENAMTEFQFNKHVVHHHFCATCGDSTVCSRQGGVNGADMVMVNIRSFDDDEPDSFAVMKFDGRSL